jgi:glycosyltransferase involved in cell wall biosynthesis
VISEFRQYYDRNARLIFAGRVDHRLNNYVEDLWHLARQLDVADALLFTGSLTNSQLKSLYVSADVLLCTSEHEGFCVPLIEAMYFRVPIVAWAATAVPETMGNCGVVMEQWSNSECAAHIYNVVRDDEKSYRLGVEGRRRYMQAFAPQVLRGKLCKIVAEITQ